jgi:tetratricopeptide (TPR) repeat protein
MRALLAVTILLSAFLAASSTGFAQTSDPLDLGIEAFYKPDYEAALKYLELASSQEHLYSKEDIAKCHRYIGMTYVAYENRSKAKTHFIMALELNPEMTFDDLTSPKILEIFDEAKEEYLKKRENEPKPTQDEGLVKSGRKITGWSLVGVGGASLATSGACYYLMWDKAWQYDDEDDPSKADDLQAESEMFGVVSGISAGIGLAAVGVGAYLLATDKARSAALKIGNVEVAFVPSLNPGIVAAGRF